MPSSDQISSDLRASETKKSRASEYQAQRLKSDPEFREYRRQKAREWKARNAEKVKADRRAYMVEYRQRDDVRAKRLTSEHREKQNARAQTRYATNPNHREAEKLRSRLHQAFRRYLDGGFPRKISELIGCSMPDLWKHLEAQFLPGMAKENYGEWEFDHRVPCSAFDLTIIEQQKECFHFSNLQPLWKSHNRRKRARLDWQAPAS